MVQMTGGEAAVQALLAHGVETIFGIPGIQNDWFYNALYDVGSKIRVIHTRHEQGAAFMALGYALARNDVSVFNVVPGPGVLNAAAALSTAYGLNAPVFCLTGQLRVQEIGRNIGLLHEIPHQLEVLRGLTKWTDRANHPTEIPQTIAESFRQLRSSRPRPVALEIPMDVLKQKAEINPKMPVLPAYHAEIDLDAIDEAARILGKAERPVIFVGGGAMGASEGITELAKMLEAPVVAYRTGRGVLDSDHYLSLTQPPAHEVWKTTDAVLAIGTNMRVPLQSWGVDDDMKIIRVEVDATAMDTLHKPDVPLVARAEDVVPALVEMVTRYNRHRESRADELLAIKARWAEQTAYLEPQNTYINAIRQELGRDGIFVDELTQVAFTARWTMPVHEPYTFFSTGYQGTLGFGFPTALGIKVASPDKPVVSINGDGGFMFCMQELATAVQHRINLVTIIFNNNQYGNVQQMQKNVYDNRVIATDLVNPDFVKLAESFGAQGLRAETGAELREAIRCGLDAAVPTIIEVPCGDMPTVDRFRSLGRIRPAPTGG